jgi:hypothetical protein
MDGRRKETVMPSRTFEIHRMDRTIEVEVYFSIRFGSADSYSPLNGAVGGDPDEVEIEGVYADGDVEIQLTDAELEKFESEIIENADDYYDPYDDDEVFY